MTRRWSRLARHRGLTGASLDRLAHVAGLRQPGAPTLGPAGLATVLPLDRHVARLV
jgi:hypothetical protein